MGVLDGPMAQVAQVLIGTLGRASCTLTRPGSRTPDPATGRVVDGAATVVACEVVLTDFDEQAIDGTTVQQGDRQAIVSRLRLEEGGGGSGFEPVADLDVLTEGGRQWLVKRVRGYSSGDSEAAYLLHVRRA